MFITAGLAMITYSHDIYRLRRLPNGDYKLIDTDTNNLFHYYMENNLISAIYLPYQKFTHFFKSSSESVKVLLLSKSLNFVTDDNRLQKEELKPLRTIVRNGFIEH